MSNVERRIYDPNLDNLSYEKRLHNLSNEVIPIFHTEEYSTLESFVSPILEESLAMSQAVSDDEMSFAAADKNLIIVVGAPGSGKTHIKNELDKLRQKIGLPDEHFRPFSWEGAEDEVKVNFSDAERSETYFSDHRMDEVNKVAINQLDNSGSWILGVGEYAPVATKIELGQPLWMGKDAGATFIEYIAQKRQDINLHVIGLCPESRVVRLATPYRNQGASPEAVEGYRKKSTRLAISMHEQRKVDLPRYMLDLLRKPNNDINPLTDENFKRIMGNSIYEFANFILEKRIPMAERAQDGIIEGFYDELLPSIFAAEIAKDDVISLASLYIYRYAFENELQIPKKRIFLGMSNPNMAKFQDVPADWNNLFLKPFPSSKRS